MGTENEVVDETTQVIDKGSEETEVTEPEETTETSESTDETEEGTETEQKPEKVGKAAQEFMDNLLAEYDLESPEDLKKFIGNLAGLKDKIGDEDIDDLLDNKTLMEKYQRIWATEEAKKKEENETPQETITRLKSEAKQREKEIEQSRNQELEARESQRLINGFNKTVNSTIKKIKEVPDEYRPFFKQLMGVDNPINDVDLSEKGTIIELTKDGAKTLLEFEQAVIKRYKAGKVKVPVMSKTTDTTPVEKSDQPKNLKESRKLMLNILLGRKQPPK